MKTNENILKTIILKGESEMIDRKMLPHKFRVVVGEYNEYIQALFFYMGIHWKHYNHTYHIRDTIMLIVDGNRMESENFLRATSGVTFEDMEYTQYIPKQFYEKINLDMPNIYIKPKNELTELSETKKVIKNNKIKIISKFNKDFRFMDGHFIDKFRDCKYSAEDTYIIWQILKEANVLGLINKSNSGVKK